MINYDFTGYPAPPLGLLIKICTNIETWIKKDSENVAVVHCYDGKGRTMTICACVMTWIGWFNNPMEALAVCLDRRGLSEDVLLPSQLRCIQNFDSLMQGVRPVGDAFNLSSLTIRSLPGIEDNTCSPFIEIYNQNELVYSSYRKGSKTKGIVTPVNAGEGITFSPNINLFVFYSRYLLYRVMSLFDADICLLVLISQLPCSDSNSILVLSSYSNWIYQRRRLIRPFPCQRHSK